MRVMVSLRKLLATKSATTVAFGALALATGLACLAAVPPAAHAAIAQCNPNYAPAFDGFYTVPSPQTGIEGVSANIRVEDGTLCSIGSIGSENITATWDMITPHQSGGYAQVGFWRHLHTGSEPVYFYAFTPDGYSGGQGIDWHTGVPVGSTHRFWVQWVTNGCPSGLLACFAFNIDTTRITVSTFDPDTAGWGDPSNPATPWDMQFFGETHNTSTDIMGSNAGGVATVWSSAQAQDWNTNQYRSFTCNLGDREDSTRYGLNYPSNHACGTWSTYTYALR